MFDHYSVMLKESVELLNIKPDGIYVDMTLGGAGHAQAIYQQLNKTGKLICFDQDITAINHAQAIFKGKDNVYLFNENFDYIDQALQELQIDKVDGVIFDLGVSSVQLDQQERGFSYRFDARLDMRMNQDAVLDAYYVVNNYSFHDLMRIISKYGEEKFAKQIARNIEKARAEKPITTTFELVDIIKKSMPQAALKKKGHPAKKTFQAIRIEVNKELDVFESALNKSVDLLNEKGRIVVISFHSLEDRIAKQLFKKLTTSNIPSKVPVTQDQEDIKYRLINSKVILPSLDELEENNRSKPSKLRVLEKL